MLVRQTGSVVEFVPESLGEEARCPTFSTLTTHTAWLQWT